MVKTDDDKAEFIPSSVMDDEYGRNKIGMAAVFGEDFVKDSTASCEYHFKNSVDRHKKHIKEPEDKVAYFALMMQLKNCSTQYTVMTPIGRLRP